MCYEQIFIKFQCMTLLLLINIRNRERQQTPYLGNQATHLFTNPYHMVMMLAVHVMNCQPSYRHNYEVSCVIKHYKLCAALILH